jgi:hypothetical protein
MELSFVQSTPAPWNGQTIPEGSPDCAKLNAFSMPSVPQAQWVVKYVGTNRRWSLNHEVFRQAF